MNKNEWLNNLKEYWEEKNVEAIVNDLFDKNVEYYRSPFEKIIDIKTV